MLVIPNGDTHHAVSPKEETAAMKFGIFFELSVPRPWTHDSERIVYENALEQAAVADEVGFDYCLGGGASLP